jgi:hypothetical protein
LDCPKEKRIRIGGAIRYFGDTFQKSKKLGERRFWRIPVMDGEFLCEDWFGTVTGVAGGNLLICGRTPAAALHAAEAAVAAIRTGRDVALPFPGGIVRSGSKVGSNYPKLKASTNDPYCPTIRGMTTTELPPECRAVYEIVIDGLSFDAVKSAMQRGLHAATKCPDVLRITAGNYGGKLGKHHFHLRDLIWRTANTACAAERGQSPPTASAGSLSQSPSVRFHDHRGAVGQDFRNAGRDFVGIVAHTDDGVRPDLGAVLQHDSIGVGPRLFAHFGENGDVAADNRLQAGAERTDHAARTDHNPPDDPQVLHDSVSGNFKRRRHEL